MKQHFQFKKMKDTWSGKSKQPFATLSRAYSAFKDGDRIVFKNGVYKNPLNCGLTFRKNVYIVSLDGDPNQVTIMCADPIGITVEGTYTLTVHRLTFTNLNGTAISLRTNARLELKDVHMVRCNGVEGGAIKADRRSTVVLENVLMANNTAGRGAAIFALDEANIQSKGNSRIEGNTAIEKGGAFYFVGTNVNEFSFKS